MRVVWAAIAAMVVLGTTPLPVQAQSGLLGGLLRPDAPSELIAGQQAERQQRVHHRMVGILDKPAAKLRFGKRRSSLLQQ